MKLSTLTCPNCGANYNPTKYQCDYCGSYIIMDNNNYVSFDNITFQKPENEKYKGIYVFGTLLGENEKPLSLGSANYYTSTYNNVGGKLLLTNHSLSFTSHTILQNKTTTVIPLRDIVNVKVTKNLLISQHISILTQSNEYIFVVYHGQEWVSKINLAKQNEQVENYNAGNSTSNNNQYDELKKLKELLDSGIITEEEFVLKKRNILNI